MPVWHEKMTPEDFDRNYEDAKAQWRRELSEARIMEAHWRREAVRLERLLKTEA